MIWTGKRLFIFLFRQACACLGLPAPAQAGLNQAGLVSWPRSKIALGIKYEESVECTFR